MGIAEVTHPSSGAGSGGQHLNAAERRAEQHRPNRAKFRISS